MFGNFGTWELDGHCKSYAVRNPCMSKLFNHETYLVGTTVSSKYIGALHRKNGM